MRNQVVLLCGGPDRCGKTNILAELNRITGIPTFKASDEHENFLGTQDRFLMTLRYADPRMVDLIKQANVSVLVDRAYMCEWVYSRFFGRQTDETALRRIDNSYANLGARILICTRKDFTGIVDDLNPKLDSEALARISGLYDEFIMWTNCRTYRLFVDDEDLDRECTEILDFMGRKRK